MNLELEDRNCIVLGGSRGIGRAIALGLVSEGANVAICARNEESLRDAEAEILMKGRRAYAHVCDVADAAGLAAFLEAARDALGGVDILVHNASALAIGPDLGDWEASLQVDLMAAVRACEQVIPWMAEAGGGSILFVSSISGLEVDPAPDFGYTAAKAALIARSCMPRDASVSMRLRRARRSFQAASGPRSGNISPRFTKVCARRSRGADWERRMKWQTSRSFSFRRGLAGWWENASR
jgi:NAD(P)-dependent dehydrogenase (short-subunit alcohol dehydrogenase family)